jgi:hypothetical protein
MLYKLGGFVSGTALGATFVVNMDDMIYGQFRRNVLLPIKQSFLGTTSKKLDLDDLFEISAGTATFVSQFKPHALGPSNAKSLLVNDQDYATPQDHYFGFLNKRQEVTPQKEWKQELEIMGSLGLEVMLPPNFNPESGGFDQPPLVDEHGQPIDEAQMDIFELARRR